MAKSRIAWIRAKVRRDHYKLTIHAAIEMADDDLSIRDIEHAIQHGSIQRIERDDPRGPKTVILG